MHPSKIKVENDSLIIEWENGEISEIELSILRFHCPCARCIHDRERKKFSRFPSDALIIDSMSARGRYALSIVWRDGHDTGIYEFEYLKKLAELNKISDTNASS